VLQLNIDDSSGVYMVRHFWYNEIMNKKSSGARPTLHFMKIDRKALSVASLLEPSDEKAYWLSKSPYERLEAAEIMRQIVYGYDPSTTRLQRVLEIAQRSQG
jgi:hypothetical protein